MIRDAEPADAPAVRTLQSLLTEPAPEILEATLEGPGVLLVSTDGEGDLPVGYVAALVGPDSAYVAELAVAPDYRREGRATALLEALLARLDERDVGVATLAVEPDNDAARRLYESLGFEVVDRDPDYYESGPALLMSRAV